MSKKKKLQKKKYSAALNISVKTGSILLSLVLMVVMVLNAPIVVYQETKGEDTITENVSILTYFKRWKPLESQEGAISKVESSEVELRSDVDVEFDDGLDLHQIIEGQFTVLFLGFDSIYNESGNLHDVNYVIQFNLIDASMNILQIPRDSYMPNYTRASTNKFNSIYLSGDSEVSNIQRVVDAVQECFGIPIDAYVTTTADNIAQIVDIIGGIPIDLPRTIYYEPGKVLYEGEQVLNGTQSEWFLRFRNGYDEGDIGRVKAQRIFLAAAMQKALDMGTFKMMEAMTEIYNQQLMGTDLSIEDIGMIADLASTIEMENVNIFMVPGEGADGPNGQSIWSIHKSTALDIVNEHFRTQQLPLTADKSGIVEWVPEGSYLNTLNDDTAQNFDEIHNNE